MKWAIKTKEVKGKSSQMSSSCRIKGMLTFVSISVDQSAFIATLSAVLTVILVAFFVIAHSIVNLLQLSTLTMPLDSKCAVPRSRSNTLKL